MKISLEKFKNIKLEKIKFKKIKFNKDYYLVMIISLIILTMFTGLFVFKKDIYVNVVGKVVDNNQVELYLSDEQIVDISLNQKVILKIEGVQYKRNYETTITDLTFDKNEIGYYVVLVSNRELLIPDLMIRATIVIGKQTWFKFFYNFI